MYLKLFTKKHPVQILKPTNLSVRFTHLTVILNFGKNNYLAQNVKTDKKWLVDLQTYNRPTCGW